MSRTHACRLAATAWLLSTVLVVGGMAALGLTAGGPGDTAAFTAAVALVALPPTVVAGALLPLLLRDPGVSTAAVVGGLLALVVVGAALGFASGFGLGRVTYGVDEESLDGLVFRGIGGGLVGIVATLSVGGLLAARGRRAYG